MRIITVSGYKGGVGKSTTAIHLAAYFADKGKTVLIDGDPNHSATSWHNLGHLPFDVVGAHMVAKAATGTDYLILDTPARPDSEDLQGMAEGCHLMILPTSPDPMALEPMFATIHDSGIKHYRVLVTLVPPFPNSSGKEVQASLTRQQVPVFESMVRRSTGFQEAARRGVTIAQVPDHKQRVAWWDYVNVGREVEALL